MHIFRRWSCESRAGLQAGCVAKSSPENSALTCPPSAALVAVAGADEASEEDGDVAGDSDSGEIGASEHVSTVTLFPDFPDQSAFPTQRWGCLHRDDAPGLLRLCTDGLGMALILRPDMIRPVAWRQSSRRDNLLTSCAVSRTTAIRASTSPRSRARSTRPWTTSTSRTSLT